MANLICKMFGHTRRSGWWGDALYGVPRGGYVDGIGRAHYHIDLECDRCGETYTAARFHGGTGSLRSRVEQHKDIGEGE